MAGTVRTWKRSSHSAKEGDRIGSTGYVYIYVHIWRRGFYILLNTHKSIGKSMIGERCIYFPLLVVW